MSPRPRIPKVGVEGALAALEELGVQVVERLLPRETQRRRQRRELSLSIEGLFVV